MCGNSTGTWFILRAQKTRERITIESTNSVRTKYALRERDVAINHTLAQTTSTAKCFKHFNGFAYGVGEYALVKHVLAM